MYRVRRNNNHWKRRWPWRWFYRPKIDERTCRHCGLPYQNGPLPDSIHRFDVGNIGCLVFPAGGYRQHEKVVRFGRWRAGRSEFYLSEFIPTEDLDDLLKVIVQTQEELKGKPNKRGNLRRVL